MGRAEATGRGAVSSQNKGALEQDVSNEKKKRHENETDG
jgi:hypothetical protein